MSTRPLVSIIIPVYNAENTLQEAISSIQAQNCPSYELIIVDNNSTDSSVARALEIEPSLRLFSEKKQSPAAARNTGIRNARGDYIAFLDADDIWKEDKLLFQLEFLQYYTDFAGISSWIDPLNGPPRGCCSLLTALFRKEVFSQVGLFNEDLLYSEDLDWFIRAKLLVANGQLRFAMLPRTTTEYRQNESSMTQGKTAKELNVLKVLSASLKERNQTPLTTETFINLPFVSIIIPLYNGAKFIREAIESALNQLYPHFEIIIIDDGSTDESSSIVNSYKNVRYYRQENSGNAAARMKGVSLASGSLIAFLDQDDIFPKEKLLWQIAPFIRDAATVCAVGKAHYFADEHFSPPSFLKQHVFTDDRISFVPGVVLCKKELLLRFPFDTQYTHGSDSDFFFRLQEANIKITKVDKTLLHIRMHAENLSHSIALYKDLLRVAKNSIARKTLVSVIIPVHNGEPFLRAAIESVLCQSIPCEILVIDDGSTDLTKEIALSFGGKVSYTYQENRGTGAARNKGISLAKGSFIAFLDADDLWEKEKLSVQMEMFRKNKALDIACCYVNEFSETALPARGILKGPIAGSILIKKEALTKIGLFSEEGYLGEFIEWYGRALSLSLNIAFDERALYKRRVHGQNTTLQRKNDTRDYLFALKEHLARKKNVSSN